MERQFMLVALFAALIAALGLVPPINLASGVPITAQSLGVMLAGTALGAKRGFAATLLFIALTLAGLPLLSGGRGGIGLLASPTAGFVIGFPFATLATGFLTERLTKLPLAAAAATGGVRWYRCALRVRHSGHVAETRQIAHRSRAALHALPAGRRDQGRAGRAGDTRHRADAAGRPAVARLTFSRTPSMQRPLSPTGERVG